LEENFKLNKVPLQSENSRSVHIFSLSVFKLQQLGTHKNSGVEPGFRQALQNSDGYLK